MTGSPLRGSTLAVVVCRDGRLPDGASESVAEASGRALVVGRDAEEAAAALDGATEVWWAATDVAPGPLAETLAPALEQVRLVILPASPDGRDTAPRLAAALRRPLLAGAVRAASSGGAVDADLLRADGRAVVAVRCDSPAVATLLPRSRPGLPPGPPAPTARLDLVAAKPTGALTAELVRLVEPDPATMDLADATRVLTGGAGLVPGGAPDASARAVLALMSDVAAALGASPGATRVVTDAGWMPYDRQIGTTGVTVDPDLYVALGVSGASQHVGGIGNPRHTVSINTDASCPMTSMADLGIVADALRLLVELAGRLHVALPAEVGALLDREEVPARG